MNELSYPIGKPDLRDQLEPAERRALIAEIAALPTALRQAVAGLSEEDCDRPYRPGGWTIRQVVHHLFDSHGNSLFRFKFALTEDNPTIKAYPEELWAELADSKAPVAPALDLVELLHKKWVALLEALGDDDWQRPLTHPVLGRLTLDRMLCLYAWHGRHHVAHVTSVRAREGF